MYNKTDLAKIKRMNLTEKQCKNILDNLEESSRLTTIDKEIKKLVNAKLNNLKELNKQRYITYKEYNSEVVATLNNYYLQLDTLKWQLNKLKGFTVYNNSKNLLSKIKIKENRVNKIKSIIADIVSKNYITSVDNYNIKITSMTGKEVQQAIKNGISLENLTIYRNREIQKCL